MHPILQTIYNGILDGQQKSVIESVQAALDAGLPPSQILNEGMIAAMAEVGQRFESGDYFVPEMLIAARAMQGGMALLKPYLKEGGVESAGKVIVGTVKGDLHDIGKNLVAMMLEGAGFEIRDLGADVPAEKFAQVVQEEGAQVVALSALLTTTMPNMKTTILALENAGVRSRVKVVVGGAPVTEAYARQIGADGFSPDASRAVITVKSLLG
jgi:5-methyltetrahydrofolate--homocysteine methyltransferase